MMASVIVSLIVVVYIDRVQEQERTHFHSGARSRSFPATQ